MLSLTAKPSTVLVCSLVVAMLPIFYFMYRVIRVICLWRQLAIVMNPLEFQKKGYLDTKENMDNLKDFTHQDAVYKVISCQTLTTRVAAILSGRPPSQSLKVRVSIPSALTSALESLKEEVKVAIVIDIGGGGGTTGHPLFLPWKCKYILQWVRKHRNVIYVTLDYSRMPECSGFDIQEDIKDCWEYLFSGGLSAQLKSFHPYLKPNFGKILITGESFGGGLALHIWQNHLLWKTKESVRICQLFLRYPLVELYIRKPGKYMGVEIPPQRAYKSAQHMQKILRQLEGQTYPAIGRDPPEGQYAAHVLSVSQKWSRYWRAPAIMKSLQAAHPKTLDHRTKVGIIHGSKDQIVPLESSERLETALKGLGMNVTLWVKHDEDHGFDYQIELAEKHMCEVDRFLNHLFSG